MSERVSPKDIRIGDVITFRGYLGLPKGKSPETDTGLVMNHHEKDGKILGFDVFPLTAHDKDVYIENDNTHYMLGSREASNVMDMGLSLEKNHRLHFKGHIIPNSGEYLNEDGKGGVNRLGTLAGSTLLGYLAEKAMRAQENYGAFFASSVEMARLKGNMPNMAMTHIEETHSVEQGKSLKIERERQDFSGDDTVVITTGVNTGKDDKKIRKLRANTPHGDGTVRDISLEDATKLSLIPDSVAEFFTQAHDARRKPFETLHQIFDIADNNPALVQRWQERVSTEDQDMVSEAKTAWFSFLNDVTSDDPEKLNKYDGVETHYPENTHG